VPEEQQEEVQSEPSRTGRRLGVLFAVLVLAALGLWFWMDRGSEPTAQANASSKVHSTLHLETFVLNLADTDQRSYLRVGIDLGLSQPKRADAPIAQVRDTILGVLGESRVDELTSSSGKAKLKEKLLQALRERVPELGVEEIYFTEFLIQR